MEEQEPANNDQSVRCRIPPVGMGSHAKNLVKSTFPACPVMVECTSVILPLRRREKCNVSSKSFKIIGKQVKSHEEDARIPVPDTGIQAFPQRHGLVAKIKSIS